MIFKILVLTIAVFVTSPRTVHAQAAEFRGPVKIGKLIGTRIMRDGTPLSLSRYRMPKSLLEQMGTWNNYLSESHFRNGAPNALNMLLWFLNMTSFADEIAGACGGNSLLISPEFSRVLTAACQWPDPAARTEQAMQNFWLAFMGYDAPESEYQAWRDFISAEYANQPARETVRAMTFAIVMNPYFLLGN